MKTKLNILYVVMALMSLFISSCEGEKDLIVIDENIPIKTSVLYMVGDATPAGWDISNPTPLIMSEDDKLVFVYEGNLNMGEFKCCTVVGDWGTSFIRPMTERREVGTTNISEEPFLMYSGDPDLKWYVSTPGKYRIVFDLREWTMSSTYLE